MAKGTQCEKQKAREENTGFQNPVAGKNSGADLVHL